MQQQLHQISYNERTPQPAQYRRIILFSSNINCT